ncbi:MAG: hypothetical protein KC467_16205, partial [Marinomonas atlantica]|nr:hypothetical protein [Marinomonas atlantica]
MNILKRRQLEKLSQENTKRKAAKNEETLAKDETKPVSKLRQNLEKKQAKKSIPPVAKEADQLDELGNELASVQGDIGHLESRVDEHDDDIQTLKSQFDDVESTGNPELETHKTIVEDCLKEMSNLDDIDERLPHKAEASKRLEDFVTGYMQSGAKYPNSVAVWF